MFSYRTIVKRQVFLPRRLFHSTGFPQKPDHSLWILASVAGFLLYKNREY